MELKSMTTALLEIMKVLKRFIYLQDKSSYLILGLFILQTYCFKFFDATPYISITGPIGSGKTLILEILNFLCNRSLLVTDISNAGFYHQLNKLHGTLILDEAEYLAQRYQREIDMAILLHGYKRGGFVLRVGPGQRRLVKFDCYGPKVFGNIGGIYSRPLKSRCITIKTVLAESEKERFSPILHGKVLKDLSKVITQLFKRKKIQEQIKSLHRDFESIEGLTGRDLELWMGMLIIAKILNSDGLKTNIYDMVVKIAIATIKKREGDALLLDWDVKFMLSLFNYLLAREYDGTSFIVAEEVFNHVINEVKPFFRMRTEDLGRKLDKESLIKRKLIYVRDKEGNLVHKTGWQINIDRLDRRVSKYKKFLQTKEEFEMEEREQMIKDLDKTPQRTLTEGGISKIHFGGIGKPSNW